MNTTKPIKRALELQTISHDHHHGLQLCWKIRIGLSKNIAPERIKKHVDWFYENHIKPHFELEEKYVFTVLDPSNTLVLQALSEHQHLHDLFNQSQDLKLNLESLETELQAHIRFEERVLFAEIQEKATPEQLSQIKNSHTETNFVELEEDTFWL